MAAPPCTDSIGSHGGRMRTLLDDVVERPGPRHHRRAGLLLDGVPAGGETAPDRDRGLVGEITDWLHDRPADEGSEGR